MKDPINEFYDPIHHFSGPVQPMLPAQMVLDYVAYKNRPAKSFGAAFALWFFLGGIGAHNFYLNRTGIAVTELLLTLSIVGIPVMWGFLVWDICIMSRLVREANGEVSR